MKSNICQIPENSADEVITGLWLGDMAASKNIDFLKNNKISCIIRALPDFPSSDKISNISYLHVPIEDVNMCALDLNNVFDQTCQYIKKCLSNKINILVHCKKGHHRSAAIICAFLIKELRLDYITGVAYINCLRPCALRRDTCMSRALFKYYMSLKNIKCDHIQCIQHGRINYCGCKISKN